MLHTLQDPRKIWHLLLPFPCVAPHNLPSSKFHIYYFIISIIMTSTYL
jgi:hypothetical protein